MDIQQFSEKIIALTPVLYRVCCAQLAQSADREDAVQEALIRAWEKRRQLKKPEYLQTWVIRILLNVCHDMQRRQKRQQPACNIALTTHGQEEQTDLRLSLLQLPEKWRMPLLLHYIEGYSLLDTASMLQLPLGTVKTRLRTGREQLKQILKEEVFPDENR